MIGFRQPPLTPAVRGLMIALGAAFVLQLSLSRFGVMPVSEVYRLLGFSPVEFFQGKIWQLLTYPFLHGGLFHLFFNLLGFYFFGSALEMRWGRRSFLRYCLLCGMGGALFHTLIWGLLLPLSSLEASVWGLTPVVGVSGAVYGLLLAFGLLNPQATLLIFFVIPMKARHFVMFLILSEVFYAVFYSHQGVAHLVHLGGLGTGYLLLKYQGPNLRGGGGGGLFRRSKRKMTRSEVRQRLRVVGSPSDDPKHGNKGLPITWN